MMRSLFFILAIIGGIWSCKHTINNRLEVKYLRCEYIQNPVGIDTHVPRFGWITQSSGSNKTQSAYQILISSTPEKLAKDIGDIFDTKKVKTPEQHNIVIPGFSINSSTRYYWKARIWDENNDASDYSNPAFFETGLLNPGDWKASWITSETVFDWNRYYLNLDKQLKQDQNASYTPEIIFTKSFSLPHKVKRATLFISGLGFYQLKINQNEITSTGLNPAFTDYNKRVLYNSYDIKQVLDTGDNTITISLGNGYFNEEAIVDWGYDKAPWRGRPRLICQVHITFENGTDTLVVSDTSWDVVQSNIVRNSIYGGEVHDFSIDYTQHDKSNIRNKAITAPAPVGRLISQVMPLEKVTRTFHPKSIKRIDSKSQVVDAGINLSGRVAITFNQNLGDTVVIKYGELIDRKGNVDLSNINRKSLDPIQTDVLIFSDSGTLKWHPRYIYHGFRYVEISGYEGDLTVDDVEVHFIHTDLERTGMFSCSNNLINKIQDATVQSYLSNYHGFPTDCPQREKNGWTADGHLAANTGLYNFNTNNAFEKWLHDINDAMLDDGRLPGIVPTSGWGYQIYYNIPDPMGPAWDGAVILMPWYTYIYNGNTRILKEHYLAMQKYMDYLKRRSPDYIVRFGLADWSTYKTETNWEITSTLYYGVLANTMSKIAKVLGKRTDEDAYKLLHNNISKSFNDSILYNPDKEYNTRTQTTLAGVVYAGFTTDEEGLDIINTLEKIIIENNYNLDCGMLGTEFVLKTLSEYDRLETLYNVINNIEKPGWGYWISQGATTLWESWENNDSKNHVIFSQLSEWFYKHILGIQPADEFSGFRHIRLNPYFPKDMDWASGYITTAYGKVEVKWNKEDHQIRVTIDVPFNSKAEFIVPDDMNYKKNNTTNNHIHLGSGKHEFILVESSK